MVLSLLVGQLLAVGEPPYAPILAMVPAQLKVPTGIWSFYAERDQTRREHLLELQEQFGYQAFTVAHYRRFSVTSRRGYVFCAKPARRGAFATRMLPRFSTLSTRKDLLTAPGQNRSELLLRDGVCRGGNARESYQTLRPA